MPTKLLDDDEMREWASTHERAEVITDTEKYVGMDDVTEIAGGKFPKRRTTEIQMRNRPEPATTCPPEGAPAHVSIDFDYATVGDYVTDCNGDEIIVTASQTGVERDLVFGQTGGGCDVCFDNGGDANLFFTCPDGDCGGGQNGQYAYLLVICIRWDGSTYRAQITSTVNTPEDLGICSWATDNGNNLAANQWVYDDLDLGPEITGHSIAIPLEKDGHIDSTLTLTFT